MKASAFSPANITGVFEICDQPNDPLLKGSRGASVSIKAGVSTSVRIKESTKSLFQWSSNGKSNDNCCKR